MKAVLILAALSISLSSCGDSVSKRTNEIRASYEEFQSEPSELGLRRLINLETDASFTGLKMALVGTAFANNPEVFQKISKNLKTESELEVFKRLRDSPELLFDFYTEKKPDGFDIAVKEATWLTTH